MAHRLEIRPLSGIGEVHPGDDLGRMIADAAEQAVAALSSGDVLVIAQKAVSKAEGRLRSLTDCAPSAYAVKLASKLGRDPRFVQTILDESREIIRAERSLLIARTSHGFVCANAGVDQSNVPGDDTVCLLPANPDTSARTLRSRLRELTGHSPAVVLSDSFGRPWRLGQTEVAIGCAGLVPLDDLRGSRDAQGRKLSATVECVADAAAAAAGCVRDKSGRDAVVLVRGLERHVTRADGPGASSIVRPVDEDLFT
jgi:coenzyme F420-0:L-glutamate ligase/coenzyme F420-1:gamma-L-glutamate ligase